MKYIVFDLEFTVLRSQKHTAETIEIGAIELQADEHGGLSMTDLYHTYVQPSRSPKISKLTTEFTGVTQSDVDNAPLFTEAIEHFKAWLGEDYYLCSWGPDDKYQLVRECSAKKMDLSWIKNYNDIQLSYTRLSGADIGQRMGLKKSLKAEELPFIGKQHNALDDAFNTAKLFKRHFSKFILECNNAAEEPAFETRIVYSTDNEANYMPFGDLANLLNIAQ
ncbi:3'-5' exonuclease [Paenibacillus pinistramenti]|uniref:3'-5' exonuclease n=1 Tax=Paenibacillus pinistramenti TaxID=1768003 RepID=UPI001108EC35|nr:3'-5' exonuclease [Paenibacillus pinistramenti]